MSRRAATGLGLGNGFSAAPLTVRGVDLDQRMLASRGPPASRGLRGSSLARSRRRCTPNVAGGSGSCVGESAVPIVL